GLLAAARRAGYADIELPIFEDTALFARGVGESTDVVSKEMYTFVDRGDRSVTLRPEGTAGVVRAVIEHGLDRGALPLKLCYAGPFFRYERPQAGPSPHLRQAGGRRVGAGGGGGGGGERRRRSGAGRRGYRHRRRRFPLAGPGRLPAGDHLARG